MAALHQAIALEPLYGSAFRRSAGFTGTEANRPDAQLRWWARQVLVSLELDIPATSAPSE